MNHKEESLRAVIDELKYENRKFEFGSKLYRLEKRIEELTKSDERKTYALEAYKDKETEFLKRIRDLKDLVSNLEKEKEDMKTGKSSLLSFGK